MVNQNYMYDKIQEKNLAIASIFSWEKEKKTINSVNCMTKVHA